MDDVANVSHEDVVKAVRTYIVRVAGAVFMSEKTATPEERQALPGVVEAYAKLVKTI